MHSSREPSRSASITACGLALVALLCSLLAGCDGDSADPQALPCAEDNALSYRNFGDPFMRDWCTGCHSSDLPVGSRAGAPPDVNLDTREGVLLWRERIEARALGEAATMPPTAGPSEGEKELLAEWLRCGTP